MQGFVKQLASIVGIIAGLLLARALFGVVGEQLAPKLGTSTTVAQIIAFILIWVIVPIALSLIASIITKALSAIKLGWLNRWLGSQVHPFNRHFHSRTGIYRHQERTLP